MGYGPARGEAGAAHSCRERGPPQKRGDGGSAVPRGGRDGRGSEGSTAEMALVPVLGAGRCWPSRADLAGDRLAKDSRQRVLSFSRLARRLVRRHPQNSTDVLLRQRVNGTGFQHTYAGRAPRVVMLPSVRRAPAHGLRRPLEGPARGPGWAFATPPVMLLSIAGSVTTAGLVRPAPVPSTVAGSSPARSR